MKTSISLALASKINLVIGDVNNSQKFISFVPPSTSYIFKFSDLNFFNNDPSVGIDANTIELNRSNFSEIVNQVPADHMEFSPTDNGHLWDVFKYIIEYNSITARAELNVEDKTKLAEAHKFCMEHYANYRKYKNALDQCQSDYNDAKCSLDLAFGEEKNILQAEWTSFREKSLMENIRTAENDLEIKGERAAVAEALYTIKNLETQKGIDNLKEDIYVKLESLFSKGVPNRAGTEYYYTDFSPLGSFDENSPAWSQLTLYSTEIDSLCRNAPPALRNLYNEGETQVENIESISFEYAVISIVREWFSEAFLCSSNWKFASDVSAMVSDGNTPAKGLIPAYLNKIICVRKLSYVEKITKAKPSTFTLPIISTLPVQKFNIKKSVAERSPRKQMNFTRLQNQAVREPPISSRQPLIDKIVESSNTNAIKFNNDLLKWRKSNIAHFVRPKAILTPKQVKPVLTKEVSFEGIKFVAFECKRLPLSPNPNPNLAWF